MRTAKKLGIKTVAIYSDADAASLHVRMADEAVRVGPAPSNQSYLNIPAIMEAIRQSKAEAVHPGYGFLSENSHFVEKLAQEGVTFIGPGEKAMAAMGDKIQSKIIAKESGVNTIPGFNGVVENEEHAISIAQEIGYPVMIKASAGGGGKGMRIAWNKEEVISGFRIAATEAQASFGDGRLLIEKYIDNPRHIEIQLVADSHGNVVYLPERECSIQRRNQKVIEEAPSVHLDQQTRSAMGQQAVSLARSVGYTSAGTVEFLVDSQRNFYFLEMNTRLQVEHPITEAITGLDLVEQMIRIAAGHKLPFAQKDISISGWAFESRVYAEDPEKYLPSIGTLSSYKEPAALPNALVRCDSGVVEGDAISMYYDPLICKLCTHASTRQDAIAAMNHALDSYVIKGVTHNIPLLRDVFSHPRFQQGDISTKFLAEEYPEGFQGKSLDAESFAELVSVASILQALRSIRDASWNSQTSFSQNHPLAPNQWTFFTSTPSFGSQFSKITVVRKNTIDLVQKKHRFEVSVNDQDAVEVELDWSLETPLIHALYNGRELLLQYIEPLPLGYRLSHYGTKFDVMVLNEAQRNYIQHMKEKPKPDLSRLVLSPMPGSVVSISVKEGDLIAEGAEVAVVEAMKMQNILRAPRVGRVKKIHVQPGHSVAADEVIVEFEAAESA